MKSQQLDLLDWLAEQEAAPPFSVCPLWDQSPATSTGLWVNAGPIDVVFQHMGTLSYPQSWILPPTGTY